MQKIEFGKSKDKEHKLACRNCDGETYHKVLESVSTHESDDGIDYWNEYEVVLCQGCKDVSFRHSSACSEDIFVDPTTGEPEIQENIILFPNRIAGRKQMKDIYLLPTEVLKIYAETHGALCGLLNILAGIGIRTLVESVCQEKNAQGVNLEKKINDLVTKGVLTSDGAKILHDTRLLGNRSAHEFIAASDKELDIAMDIVENLLETVYVIPQKAKRLNNK